MPWQTFVQGLYRPADAGLIWSQRPPRWWWSLLLLVLPLILLSVTVQVQLLQMFPPDIPEQGWPVLHRWAMYMALTSLAAAFALALVASLLADAFDGRADLDAAMAAVAVAMVPLAAARMTSALPLGVWLSTGLLAWAAWLLYQGLGPALCFRTGRAAHLFASLMGMLLCALAVGWQLRDLIPGAAPAVRMGRLWLV
ncbi:YIP1 family protein [Methylonatrum kenyense]|uniref:YIP1 family protein n=1 Tax=Methylonatrum kenyense TaxID=455253 RepID=UPI0020C0055F|nr:YIP1 family protein [Methylonatrum kenyense]MCK8516660.1 YIP1 family protein [Methylonatrum kenyense]